MLNKREKILLQFMVALLVFALLFMLVFTPFMTAYIKSNAQKASLTEELNAAEEVMEAPGIAEALKVEQQRTDKNYEYFYSVLNSYSIDGIVNELLQRNALKVVNLHISPYEDAFYDFTPQGEDIETGEEEVEEDTQEQVLVKSIIQLNVEGEYDSILNFIDGLNETSTCLRVNSMSLSDQEAGISISTGMNALLEIYVYGIDMNIMMDDNATETITTEEENTIEE